MIIKSIKAPGFASRVLNSVFPGLNPHSFPKHTQQQHHPRVEYTPPDRAWPKERYTHFIENIKERYKAGDLVTFHDQAELLNEVPKLVYKIQMIEELWYKAELDRAIFQPKALNLVPVKSNLPPGGWWCAPSRMRLLTPNEVALVNLQHSPPQGSA